MEHELSLKEIQDCEYKILEYFSKLCEENNLKYYLFYGTLIGAVRHKDFIPWDDDVDVVMLREDYEKLLTILKHEDKYTVLTNEVDDYYFPFAKLVDPSTYLIEKGTKPCSQMGVWIDIFPLDKVPKNKMLQKIQFKSILKLVGLSRYISASEETIENEITTKGRKIKYMISRLFSKKAVINMIEMLAKMYRNNDEYKLANLVWASKYVTFLPEWLDHPVKLFFRNDYFLAPWSYHDILVAGYGDYQKLPPENQRCSNHNYKCWKKEICGSNSENVKRD